MAKKKVAAKKTAAKAAPKKPAKPKGPSVAELQEKIDHLEAQLAWYTKHSRVRA